MFNKIKAWSKNHFNDLKVRIGILHGIILCGLHLYQFFDSHFMAEPLFRAVFCIIFCIISIFVKFELWYVFFFVYGILIECFARFNDFESFFIVITGLFLFPEKRLFLLIPYILAVAFVATTHQKSPIHVFIHFGTCSAIYFYAKSILRIFIKNKEKSNDKKTVPLKLTDDDIRILDALSNGEDQSHIYGFSAATVSRRLLACKNRNDCKTREELLMRYIQQKK